LKKCIGYLDPQEMEAINQKIRISLDVWEEIAVFQNFPKKEKIGNRSFFLPSPKIPDIDRGAPNLRFSTLKH
jgi:hypothetical protein